LDGLDPINPLQEEARWLLQQPTVDQSLGAPLPDDLSQANYEATFSRMHVAHASIGPPCGLAVYRDGKLQVWTHCQGVYPLRAALARRLKIDPMVISVKHLQGPGCYGHNGADDAAADAAVIAFLKPGTPIRVCWRREEEFGFEPVSPSMVVTVRATLDEAERPIDWTTEIWSGKHVNRPGSGGNLLAAEALPDPPPPPPTFEAPGPPGAGTRNGEPLDGFAAKRIVHHLIPDTPVRTSSLRGLPTMNVFAIEAAMDDLVARANQARSPVPLQSLVLNLFCNGTIWRIQRFICCKLGPKVNFATEPRAVNDLRISYPVAIDNNYAIWRAFENHYWPAHYFIDAQGRVRYRHFGEGEYEQSERMIQQLLQETDRSHVATGTVTVSASGAMAASDGADVQSPETYVGYRRAEKFG
jgi:hypothetical protein